MTWKTVVSNDAPEYYLNNTTGETTSDPSVMQAQESINNNNLSQAFKQIYGYDPNSDWLNKTAQVYQDKNLSNVLNDLSTSKATSGFGFNNRAGNQDDYSTGSKYFQNQGYTGGTNKYGNMPTQYFDKNGNLVASYGVIGNNDGGSNTSNWDSSAFQWIDAKNTPEGYKPLLAVPRKEPDNINELLFGAGIAALLGGAAFLPELAGGLGGAGAAEAGLGAAAEAFPVWDPGLIAGTELGGNLAELGGAASSAAELGGSGGAGGAAAAGGSSSGGSGLSLSQALQYGKTGLGALKTASSLAGLGGSGGASSGSGVANYGGLSSGTSGGAINGPWNNNGNPLTPQTITWTPHQQAAINFGGGKQIFDSISPGAQGEFGSGRLPSFFSYGTTPQSSNLSDVDVGGYAEGGNVSHESKGEHIPEFITGVTGHYVQGQGTGQSDEIPAMLAKNEFVFDADTVAQLGDGSSDAGAKLLDEFRKSVREHKRSAPSDKIPPKASPLTYMKQALKRAGR